MTGAEVAAGITIAISVASLATTIALAANQQALDSSGPRLRDLSLSAFARPDAADTRREAEAGLVVLELDALILVAQQLEPVAPRALVKFRLDESTALQVVSDGEALRIARRPLAPRTAILGAYEVLMAQLWLLLSY